MSMFVDVVTTLLTSILFNGLILFPLAVLTLLRGLTSLLKFGMVQNGYVECNMIRHNNTIDTTMRPPKGKKIIYKGRKFPFSDSHQYILRSGPMPKTYYDLVTGLQLPLKALDRELIDNEKIDTAMTTSYDLGYKDGLDRVKRDETVQIIMLIGIIIIILGLAYIGFNITELSKTVPDLRAGMDAVNNAVKGLTTSGPKVVS